MLYKEIAPDNATGKLIRCFWMLEHDYRMQFHTHEHLWADTHAELIFSFGAPYYTLEGTRRRVVPRNFVSGPFTRNLLLYSDGFTGFVATRFQPWGLYPFSLKPVASLANTIAPAAEVLGDKIDILAEQL